MARSAACVCGWGDDSRARLGFVELGVGAAQQAHHIVFSLEVSEAKGECNPGLRKLFLDLLKLRRGRLERGVRQDANELIAAIAQDQVLATKAAPEAGGKTLQHLVARDMAATVLDLLEPAKVEACHRKRSFLAPSAGDLAVRSRDPRCSPQATCP